VALSATVLGLFVRSRKGRSPRPLLWVLVVVLDLPRACILTGGRLVMVESLAKEVAVFRVG
jgi:hypothetical protein